MSAGLPAATKAQKKLHDDLRDIVGCAVCRFITKPEVDELGIPAIHHLLSGGKRISHDHVIPLCDIHHQYPVDGHESIHSHNGKSGRAAFKMAYGVDDFDLMEMCETYLDRPYSSEKFND